MILIRGIRGIPLRIWGLVNWKLPLIKCAKRPFLMSRKYWISRRMLRAGRASIIKKLKKRNSFINRLWMLRGRIKFLRLQLEGCSMKFNSMIQTLIQTCRKVLRMILRQMKRILKLSWLLASMLVRKMMIFYNTVIIWIIAKLSWNKIYWRKSLKQTKAAVSPITASKHQHVDQPSSSRTCQKQAPTLKGKLPKLWADTNTSLQTILNLFNS